MSDVKREFSAWSFLRNVLDQGRAIEMDNKAGKYSTYEHLSARLDEAARERASELEAELNVNCPDCRNGTPPKPADVAKVRTWYPILNGSSFMGMGNNDDMDHAECRDGFVTRLDYDALAAKVEKLEQAGRVLVASNTRIFDDAHLSADKGEG